MTHALCVFDIHLHNLHGPLPIQAVRAHALNGLFHTELGRRDPKLVEELHQSKKPMPFSLAPLVDAERGEFRGFRVGTLTAELGERIAEVWGGLMIRRAEVQLGSACLTVEDVHVPDYPRATSYAQLLEEAPVAHGVWLEFQTPMRVLANGQRSLMPTPHAVWQFYANKWETFADGAALPPNFLAWVAACVHVSDLKLEARFTYVEKDVEWKGAMGVVEYQANTEGGDVPASRVPDYLRAWQALALLGEFCGTGEKTTMGMGRTHRVKVFARHKDARSA
jgi:CRISPR/Cas system endoribonuclease Cas6 (RAMP superfamily)